MNDLNNWGRVMTSVLVVVGFLAVTILYMTQKLQGNPVPEILSILLGALATNFTSVVGYWIGGSSGSTSKDAALVDIAKKVPSIPVVICGALLGGTIAKIAAVLA